MDLRLHCFTNENFGAAFAALFCLFSLIVSRLKKRINEMGSCIYRFVHGSKKHTQIVIITKNIK